MPKRELLLLALDDPSIQQLVKSALRASNYESCSVEDGAGLEKVLSEQSPALLLLGENFDGQGGLRLAEKTLERFPTLPIILYAERQSSELSKEVIKAGISDCIHPPLSRAEILQAVQNSTARALRIGDWLRREVRKTTSSLEERAKLSEVERARFESMFSSIQDGLIVLDEHNRILLLNRAACEMFHITTGNVIGKELCEIISHPDIRSLVERASREPVKYHEVNMDEGQILNAQLNPIPGIGSAITIQDISYLKELDRAKTDFIQTVSHDLRSPLTAVMGYAELIDRVGPLTGQQRDFLQRLQGSVRHITTLVNDMLDLGRLEGGFDTRRETVSVGSILKYTLDIYGDRAQEKGVVIASNSPADLPMVRANPIRIRQLLDNLVGNAIKYTPAGGKVSVGIEAQDNQIILEVRDTGPGIPQDEHNRIFEKFYRASNAPEGVSGTGLGLAIVKSIVESYQGRIWVESAPGQGSSFFVVLHAVETGS